MNHYYYNLPNYFGMSIFGIIAILFFVIVPLIIWIWAIIDCLSSERGVVDKLIWLLIILVFNFIGALIYFALRKNTLVDEKKIKGKKLYRSKNNRIIAGVCGGLGRYLGVDPTIIRLLWVLFIFALGGGILAYIIAWIIIPEKG